MNHRVQLFVVMVVIGTIGIFVTPLGLSSALVAFFRALIGSITIGIYLLIGRQRVGLTQIKSNIPFLLGTGFAMGFNWIFLFEAFRYANVALGTIIYYLAPVIIVVTAPIFFKEKLTTAQILSTLVAFGGLILITGTASGSGPNVLYGVINGLGAAILYASIMIMNKKMQGIDVIFKTGCQLLIAALVMGLYCLINGDLNIFTITFSQWLVLLVVGIVHTGFAYVILFNAFDHLHAQTSSIMTYVDPVTAILLSLIVLGEHLSVWQLLGSSLILLATLVNELIGNKTSLDLAEGDSINFKFFKFCNEI